MPHPATNAVKTQTTFLGHPIGLYILFFTEMWERFSYYGMRALLMLYMVNYFRWSQSEASSVYKWYTSLVYVTPLIGGFLADRYLGNRMAVIIGALLMAFGHFFMAFEQPLIFYLALVLLIIGNGFFKPNMSTQVGRLYGKGDMRKDGAYTIFYMGVNLGAFLSPLACGWLAENTQGGYHSGFFIAGVGMVLGLLTYLIGSPLIRELPEGSVAPGEFLAKGGNSGPELTEEQAQVTPEAYPALNRIAMVAMNAGGLGFLAWAAWSMVKSGSIAGGASSVIIGLSLLTVAFICSKTTNAVRDRVLAITLLGLFVIFFWAAFEQAGNALNLWADKTTNRTWNGGSSPISLYPTPGPAPSEGASDSGTARASLWNLFALKEKPVPPPGTADETGEAGASLIPTAWFQSINALGIFILGPVFAWIWLKVDLSTPFKMVLGLFFMGLSFTVMTLASMVENQPTLTPLTAGQFEGIRFDPAGKLEVLAETPNRLAGVASLPEGETKWEVAHAGRIRLEGNELRMTGVLSDIDRDRIAGATAPVSFRAEVNKARKELARQVEENQKTGKSGRPTVTFKLPEEVKGFDPRYSDLNPAVFSHDSASATITLRQPLTDKDAKLLLVCAANPDTRKAIDSLYVQSARHKVSPWWLVWCYILATIGELCTSPVGLSMTNKLAPARFSTMLMGLWLLTSAFGNYAAGSLGEIYGLVAPVEYFGSTSAALVGAGAVLLLAVIPFRRLMHGVK
ncbi:MAG: peptide MFS transporter [Gemmataceae bacterium]